MWCRSAVNRCFLSRSAAWRTRSSALGAPARPGVRSAIRSGEFPLASPLPSPASAAGSSALSGGFPGTTGLSDFPRSSIIGVCPWTSRCGLRPPRPQTNAGSPGSRSRCLSTCAGSLTARGPSAPRDSGPADVAFRLPPRRRHPGVSHGFRGSIPGPYLPLSTLRGRPYGRSRMTRGRRGSLRLRRMTLSFTAPRRCDRRTETPMDLDEAMRTTFSAREFTADPLPDAALADILDRARFAPSGGNRQGWKVIVVRDNATREALARLTEPAAKRYIAQQKNGENPWNTIDPPRVDAATIERTEPLMRLIEPRSEEHTSELQSLAYLVCRLLLEKKKKKIKHSKSTLM